MSYLANNSNSTLNNSLNNSQNESSRRKYNSYQTNFYFSLVTLYQCPNCSRGIQDMSSSCNNACIQSFSNKRKVSRHILVHQQKQQEDKLCEITTPIQFGAWSPLVLLGLSVVCMDSLPLASLRKVFLIRYILLLFIFYLLIIVAIIIIIFIIFIIFIHNNGYTWIYMGIHTYNVYTYIHTYKVNIIAQAAINVGMLSMIKALQLFKRERSVVGR